MTERSHVELELRDGAAWITLCDGDRGNALEAETRSVRERADSADGREGVRAFLDKRAPRFGD